MPLKGIGFKTLFLMAPELGTAIVLVDVGRANPELRKRLLPFPMRPMHAGTVHWKISRRQLRRQQKLGGKNSRKYLPKRAATKLAKKAANSRWSGKRHKLGRPDECAPIRQLSRQK